MLSVVHQNVQSIGNSINQLNMVVSETLKNDDLCAVCITEHWKTKEQISNFGIDGFILASAFCRDYNEHGGAAIYVKEGLKFSERVDLLNLSVKNVMEIAAVDVRCSDRDLLVVSVYAASGESARFLGEFEKILEMVSSSDRMIVIGGDFNIDLLSPTNRWSVEDKSVL
ncbi:uncharacterized protein LOC123306984 [Coccinella septempunctata]|uniref:uncharacterized protein LOC123306984 n=1 Tax=Coccinella septempunctata TaxID=41139 RepID=UPI001D069528|nr:uncharacterized protein LOC123306984 [Coccinella septempunctata]